MCINFTIAPTNVRDFRSLKLYKKVIEYECIIHKEKQSNCTPQTQAIYTRLETACLDLIDMIVKSNAQQFPFDSVIYINRSIECLGSSISLIDLISNLGMIESNRKKTLDDIAAELTRLLVGYRQKFLTYLEDGEPIHSLISFTSVV